MIITKFAKPFLSLCLIGLSAHANLAQAHSAGAVLGWSTDDPSASALAEVTCGAGTHHLTADVQDRSAPEFGQYINLLLYRGVQAIAITDPESGDGQSSPAIKLQGGPGLYRIFLSKTGASPRAFEITYHCEASDGTHTETDIVVRQFQ